MYLAFNGFTSQIPFFYGRVVFCRTWLEGACYLLSKILLRSFLEFWRQFQHVSLCRLLSKNSILFMGEILGSLATVSAHLVMLTAVQELGNLIPISSHKKGTTSGAKALANYLAPSSSSSGHATQWPTFLSPSTWLWSAVSLTLSWLPLAVSRCAC